jgi:surface carbohydrate biosynthesis protein
MNIYIAVEIKYREFLSRLLLGAASALNDNDVFLGDDEIFTLIEKKKLNPGILLLKSITPIKRRMLQLENYKKNKCIVTSLDEEGGLPQVSYRDFAFRRYSYKSLSYTDAVFCWGEYDFKNNVKIFPKSKKKFLITGNPRFDLLDNTIAKNFVKPIKTKQPKVVIISSYMVFARSLAFSDQFLIKDQFKDDYHYDHFSYRAAMSTNYIKLLKRIINHFPNIEIDIWIHPNESIANWKKIVPDRKNIKFTSGTKFLTKEKKDNTIFIHSGSGLAFNALLQNKIVISYQPIKSKWNNTLPNTNSLVMKSDSEIINYIKKKRYDQFKVNKKKLDYLSKVIFNSKNYDACYKIASHWEKFKNENLSKKNGLSKIMIKNQLRLIKQKINYKVYNRKFPPFTHSELVSLKKILVKFNPEFKNLKFSLIGPKLINIKK